MEERLIYDDGSNKEPSSLAVDFEPVNKVIEASRTASLEFLRENLA